MIEIQTTIVMGFDHAKFCAFIFAKELPRYQIGMVFHFTNDNFILVFNETISKTMRHQVDTFGGSFGKNNFFDTFCMDKTH